MFKSVGIKLLSHTMKVWERTLDERLRLESVWIHMDSYGDKWQKSIEKNRKNSTWYL